MSSQLQQDAYSRSNALTRSATHAIKRHLRLLFGVQQWMELHDRSPPLTDEECNDYARGLLPPPTAQNFRIDFVRGWKTFPYNQAAAAVFCKDFMDAVAAGVYASSDGYLEQLTPERVRQLLDHIIRRIRAEI